MTDARIVDDTTNTTDVRQHLTCRREARSSRDRLVRQGRREPRTLRRYRAGTTGAGGAVAGASFGCGADGAGGLAGLTVNTSSPGFE